MYFERILTEQKREMDYIQIVTAIVGIVGVFLTIWSRLQTKYNNQIAKMNAQLSEKNTALAEQNAELVKQNVETAKLNLQLAEDNRRNALREHLFKEQMMFFKEIARQVVALGVIFDSIQDDNEISDENDDKLEEGIDELNAYFDANVLIIPSNEIFDCISLIMTEAAKLHILLIKQNGKAANEHYDKFFDAFYIATENIREFYGIEELSKETLEITRSKRKSGNR